MTQEDLEDAKLQANLTSSYEDDGSGSDVTSSDYSIDDSKWQGSYDPNYIKPIEVKLIDATVTSQVKLKFSRPVAVRVSKLERSLSHLRETIANTRVSAPVTQITGKV